ncbi:KGK domain-containing protein [Calothrix sp. 336/3]|uniref:KGK domain-containing protein n=1 Tax=Calothrix sp. 336/3 TaxID=1337936 RepID=UPI000624F22D|nr:KGK domain-containing protein [Calothrix sp. 336/3]AKG22450.1 hypothetical protein IJ00_15300 [Calothrix sp. 336/3]
MSEQWETLDQNDVIVFNDFAYDSEHTKLVSDFIKILKHASLNGNSLSTLFEQGLNCAVLIPGKEWRLGKIKLSLEFASDELKDIEHDLSNTTIEKSPLDDLREKIKRIEDDKCQ